MNFVDMIMVNAITIPGKPAMILPDRIVTYGMLGRGVRSVERHAVAAGLKRNDVVALMIGNQVRHVTIAIAMLRIGVVTVSVKSLEELTASGLSVTRVLMDENQPLDTGSNHVLVDGSWFDGGSEAARRQVPAGFAADDICRIAFSSGTTGIPKPIAHTAAAMDAYIASCFPVLCQTPWERALCTPPIASHYGFGVAMFVLSAGRSLLFASSAEAALQTISVYAVDYVAASTQQVARMLETRKAAPHDCSSIRLLHIAGSLPTKTLIRTAQAQLCNTIMCVYGSTEASIMAFAPTAALRSIEGAVGIIAPWADLEIVDDEGAVVDDGLEGRVRVRSTGQGYDYAPRRTADSPQPDQEWFYPGDIGCILEDRLLVLTGRSSEVINRGGQKFAPELVESHLLTIPGVSDAGAVGVQAGLQGEELWIAVVADRDLPHSKIKESCARANRNFVPDQVFLVDRIPRTDTGKIARVELREHLRTLQ